MESVNVTLKPEVRKKLNKLKIDPNKWAYLKIMQGNPQLYKGTVSRKVKLKRRAANKVARKQRKVNAR